MTSEAARLVLLLIAAAVVPCLYLALCAWMLLTKVPRPPFVTYFFLFGVLGGSVFAFAMSPSGIAALSIVFLGTMAPAGTLLGAALVWHRRSLTWYHRCALYLSLGYPAVVALGIVAVAVMNGHAF